MALKFRRVWPDAPAGTMETTEINARRFDYALGELAAGTGQVSAPGVLSYLTQDGLSGGDTIVDPAGCPFVWVQIADASDYTAISQMGRWGPIMDPADDRLAQDLFMWRVVHYGATDVWSNAVYQTGLAGASGYFDARSAGRHFIQYSMGDAP